MNKQEVLEELETTSTQFFHVATSTGVEANNKTLSTGVFAGLGIAKSVLTKLEEPQKVKARLAKHWDEDLGDCLWWNFPVEEPPYCGTPLDEHFPKYKTHFSMIDMPNEIEKPKRWVVKKGKDCVLTSFTFFDEQSVNYNSNSYGKDYLIFTDKSKAEAVAVLVEGSVEKI